MGSLLVKVGCVIFVNCLCKIQSHNVFKFLILYRLFYRNGKAKYQPCVHSSPNPEFIREKILKVVLHPVQFLDTLFPVYKLKRVSSERHLLISLLKNC